MMNPHYRQLLPDISPDPNWRAKLAEAKDITNSTTTERRPTRTSRERELLAHW